MNLPPIRRVLTGADAQGQSSIMEDGMQLVCETLAVAFEKRLKPPTVIRSKYDHLVVNGVISAPELALAISSSRRKGSDLESVLVDEFQVSLKNIGQGLSHFYGVNYEPYQVGRSIPLRTTTLQRAFVESHEWLVIESSDERIHVMCTDPEELIEHNIVGHFFLAPRYVTASPPVAIFIKRWPISIKNTIKV